MMLQEFQPDLTLDRQKPITTNPNVSPRRKWGDLKKQSSLGTSLVAQWLRSRLPMQATRVRSLVQEDPTCHGATKPMCHDY